MIDFYSGCAADQNRHLWVGEGCDCERANGMRSVYDVEEGCASRVDGGRATAEMPKESGGAADWAAETANVRATCEEGSVCDGAENAVEACATENVRHEGVNGICAECGSGNESSGVRGTDVFEVESGEEESGLARSDATLVYENGVREI